MVSAVVEQKPCLGSYLKVCLEGGRLCHEWGLGSLLWCRSARCVCYRASIGLSVTYLENNVRLTPHCLLLPEQPQSRGLEAARDYVSS